MTQITIPNLLLISGIFGIEESALTRKVRDLCVHAGLHVVVEAVEVLIVIVPRVAKGSRVVELIRPGHFERHTAVLANSVVVVKSAQQIELQRDAANELRRRRGDPAAERAAL